MPKKKRKDMKVELMKLNGHTLKVRVPVRSISLDEAIRRSRRIIKKYC